MASYREERQPFNFRKSTKLIRLQTKFLSVAYSFDFTRFLWYCLFIILVSYNFHRYILKYSHGAFAKAGYQQTPFIWQVGKYIIVGVILALIYLRSKFTTHIPTILCFFYAYITYVLCINIGSIFFYHEVMTDELEYVVFSFILLPLGFIVQKDIEVIANEIKPFLNISQYILILSNWIVVFNYYAFNIIPFHAFGGIMMRYGGLWDDPNTFAIISVLLIGYALSQKQYVLVFLHIINVLLTISLNGYLLLLTLIVYWFLANSKRKILNATLFVVIAGLITILIIHNLDDINQLYQAKRQSIEQHSTLSILNFYWIPFLQPIIFHETWFLSSSINYFPVSIIFISILSFNFLLFFVYKPRSIQRLLFILFFVTSMFLPFLYMFPINFIAVLFLVLYAKGIHF